MEFKSQICTNIEQSERLMSLGLKKETADMSISTRSLDTDNGIKYSLTPYNELSYPKVFGAIPAWSLDRLLEIAKGNGVHNFMEGNRYDDVIALIQSYIHLRYINEEYLDMDIVNARENKNVELLAK